MTILQTLPHFNGYRLLIVCDDGRKRFLTVTAVELMLVRAAEIQNGARHG